MSLNSKVFDDPGKDLSGILEKVIENSPIQDIVYKDKIDQIIKKDLPESINSQIKLIDLKNGLLTLECESSSWREEIKLRADSLIDQINESLNKNIVKSIKVV